MFVGSVFSPYYAWARQRGTPIPEDHCAFNVALYGEKRGHWCMTERDRHALRRDRDTLVVGPSQARWVDGELLLDIDELTFPRPAYLRGRIRLTPRVANDQALVLDPAGRHRWCALAPCARVQVELEKPRVRWEGEGYLDTNAGDEPLEDGFSGWHWSRASDADGTTVLYDVTPRQGEAYRKTIRFDRQGAVSEAPAPASAPLPTALWGIRRRIPADAPEQARLIETLEDTPFYARSLVATAVDGRPLRAVHESLDLNRFASAWVKPLLPFRMPRRATRTG
ncbi:carotenoid 1,2-hydratase [Halorhodospira halophila]|nr:carotenoid 1,2-hydratase [Halorhodospira halophila]